MHLHSRSRVLYVLLFSTIFVVGLSFAFLYVFPSSGIGSVNSTNNASALTYSSNTDISFTFNPTLSISLSDTNINIDNLLPGLSSESSPITVHVNSNTPYGYSLFASVGNSTDYNTTSLVHSSNDNSNNNSSNDNNNSNNNNNSIPATFTSIATNASLPQLDTDNTWGYSFSNDNGSTWSNYNGLPLYSTVDNNTSTNNPALLIDTKNPADSTESIDFKIAAKASSTQASGTYNNVINFYAVGKPAPVYMQETEIIKSKLKNTGDEMQVIDNRDGKTYWIAKQADGNIWMTQNLDLCIGCEGTATLTSRNTDLNEYGNGIYDNGYSISDGKINWAPAETAITSSRVISKEKNYSGYYDVPNWTNSATLPSSAEGSDVVVYSSNSQANDAAYSSVQDCENGGRARINCEHYKVGDYYNWTAAVASNDSSSANKYYTAANSICPAGWKLPQGTSDGSIDFGTLFYASNVIDRQTYYLDKIPYTDKGFGRIRSSPLYYTRGGNIGGSMLYTRTIYGYYWSGTIGDFGQNGAYWAQELAIFKDGLSVRENGGSRSGGFLVRCVIR